MTYVAVKPCKLKGQAFKIGETIPADALEPGAAKNLIKMGIIASKDSTEEPTIPKAEPEEFIEVDIDTKEGKLNLKLTKKGLQDYVDVMTSKVEPAEAIVKEMTDTDALIMLDISETRKTIKEAAKARALQISQEEGEE